MTYIVKREITESERKFMEELRRQNQKDEPNFFYIPCAYELYGHIKAYGNTVEEAFEWAEAHQDDIALTDVINADYVEGSFEIDHAGVVKDRDNKIVDTEEWL